jgi:hypothetical protein
MSVEGRSNIFSRKYLKSLKPKACLISQRTLPLNPSIDALVAPPSFHASLVLKTATGIQRSSTQI